MRQINHLNLIDENIINCKRCKKDYFQWTEDQVAGSRDREYDLCPYCGSENGSSMEVEYHNRKKV